jgi:hypothetical protein
MSRPSFPPPLAKNLNDDNQSPSEYNNGRLGSKRYRCPILLSPFNLEIIDNKSPRRTEDVEQSGRLHGGVWENIQSVG